MRKYLTLFFDLDHTLWDFERNSEASLACLYEEFDLQEKGIADFDDFNQLYHTINERLWDRFRKGWMSREDLRWKRMFQTLVHYRVADEKLARQLSERYLEVLPEQTHVFPYCVEILEYCRDKGYALHLITNGFERTQHLKLKHAAIDGYFDQMITSEQAMSMKPNKAIFEYALKQTGASVRTSLMIGDALDVDILGAQEVGMDQVYFNPKQTAHDASPTYEIHHLRQLENIL